MKNEMIQRLFLEVFHKYAHIFKKIDFLELSRTELALMEIVMNRTKQKSNTAVRDLAKILDVSSPAISRTVKSLVDRGFLERKILSDRRNTYLEVTPKGQRKVAMAEDKLNQIGNRVIEYLGQERAHQFAVECSEVCELFELAILQEKEKIQYENKN